MAEVLSYCGYRCDRCPAYHANLTSDDDRKRVQEGWIKYYDHRVEVNEVDCRGCSAGPREGNPDCRVRPCAVEKGLRTCADCDEFACDKIARQMDAIKPIAQKHGEAMPPEDYERYISP